MKRKRITPCVNCRCKKRNITCVNFVKNKRAKVSDSPNGVGVGRKNHVKMNEMPPEEPITFITSPPKIFCNSEIKELKTLFLEKFEYKESVEFKLPEKGKGEGISEYEILIVDPNSIGEEDARKIFHPTSKVRWIHSTWAGVDQILKMAANMREYDYRPILTKSGEGLKYVMSEYVVQQVLNEERRANLVMKMNVSKEWLQGDLNKYKGIRELKFGVMGFGTIGGHICNVLDRCFDAKEIFVFKLNEVKHKKFKIFTDLDRFLQNDMDYLINILPSTSKTKGLLNGKLYRCNKKVIFMNIGRGDIITEEEIIKAIEMSWIEKAILDVFENEPLPQNSKLWGNKKVYITPHIAGVSLGKDIFHEFLNNFKLYCQKMELKGIVNWDLGY